MDGVQRRTGATPRGWGASTRPIRVQADQIYVQDGHVWTSAGISAGIDLSLALIEADHGRDLSKAVARELVVPYRRAGGQSQHTRR